MQIGEIDFKTENKEMNQAQYSKLFSFLWNIANDVLVHAFEKGKYKDRIMPMLVLRRIDVLLEPTKEKVLETKKQLEEMGIVNGIDPALKKISGFPFYNTSKFTLKTLINETDPARLKMNMFDYLNGYSPDVLDNINKFHMRQQIDNLTETDRLGSLIAKFTDSSINLSINPMLDDKSNEVLPRLDNHSMGTIFEELLNKFNGENNVTEAGEHFTPRNYVKLLDDIAVVPEMEYLSNILDEFNALYGGHLDWQNPQEVIEQINQLPDRVAAVESFVNTARNSTPQNAEIESNNAMETIVLGLLRERTEFARNYFENAQFRAFINERVFTLTYRQVRR